VDQLTNEIHGNYCQANNTDLTVWQLSEVIEVNRRDNTGTSS